MKDNGRTAIVGGLTAFVLIGAALQAGVAVVYWRGVTRVDRLASLDAGYVRVMARPLTIAAGDDFPRSRLASHLQTIGYYEGCAGAPGCFMTDEEHDALTIWGRYPELSSAQLRWNGTTVASILSTTGTVLDRAVIEAETLLTSLDYAATSRSRASHDPVPEAALAHTALVDAIVASEDRWFQSHHGVDFPRLALTPFIGSGASTITMQVARLNVLQDRSRTLTRKLNEIGVAMAIERAFSKREVLSAYINTVGLGARGGRPIHGFGAGAREFFGVRDVRLLTPLQAATLVALLNQPSRYLDRLSDGDDSRLRGQRNRVLRLMHRNFPERYSDAVVRQLEQQRVTLAPAAGADPLLKVSRHFLDYALAGIRWSDAQRVYLTLDAERQRIAAEAVDAGLKDLRYRVSGRAYAQLQAALVAIDPLTGEVVAMIGGRAYDDSQLNRATAAHRQVGSIMKPFDYLAAFERGRSEGRTDLSPSTQVVDRPTVFTFRGWRPWTPVNYGNDYAGVTTWRRALAESRNVAAVKVAALAGFTRVADLWQAASGQALKSVFPSIALGSLESTPMEVATAYQIFASHGVTRPLHGVSAIGTAAGAEYQQVPATRVADEASTAAVTGMLRAVVDEGTGRGARAAGFTLDAAGKTGTTNELRDAWFAGFSGRLLTVVWVGCDDDQPLGLTGAQAALPIWTAFMKRALQPANHLPHGEGGR
jgi:penicillin-binding protein 1B